MLLSTVYVCACACVFVYRCSIKYNKGDIKSDWLQLKLNTQWIWGFVGHWQAKTHVQYIKSESLCCFSHSLEENPFGANSFVLTSSTYIAAWWALKACVFPWKSWTFHHMYTQTHSTVSSTTYTNTNTHTHRWWESGQETPQQQGWKSSFIFYREVREKSGEISKCGKRSQWRWRVRAQRQKTIFWVVSSI